VSDRLRELKHAARTIASMKSPTVHRSQSKSPLRASQFRSAKCIRSQMPSCCQSRRRRQQVIPDPQPSSFGNICHGIPLRRTKTIPVRQARSEMRGVHRSVAAADGQKRFDDIPQCVGQQNGGDDRQVRSNSRRSIARPSLARRFSVGVRMSGAPNGSLSAVAHAIYDNVGSSSCCVACAVSPLAANRTTPSSKPPLTTVVMGHPAPLSSAEYIKRLVL
jgi:hypothetical protein